MSCTRDNQCRSLTAKCVNGVCTESSCDNRPDDPTLTNADLICMNYIDSGPYAGCYTCPNARSVGGTCSCAECILEPSDYRSLQKSKRCCSSVDYVGDISFCIDDVPSPLPDGHFEETETIKDQKQTEKPSTDDDSLSIDNEFDKLKEGSFMDGPSNVTVIETFANKKEEFLTNYKSSTVWIPLAFTLFFIYIFFLINTDRSSIYRRR